jgi:hypothetical protein
MELIDLSSRRKPRRRPNYAAEEKMHPLQMAGFRRMTPAEKLDSLARMYWAGRELLAIGIRSRHPEWTEQEVAEEVRVRMLYGTT